MTAIVPATFAAIDSAALAFVRTSTALSDAADPSSDRRMERALFEADPATSTVDIAEQAIEGFAQDATIIAEQALSDARIPNDSSQAATGQSLSILV